MGAAPNHPSHFDHFSVENLGVTTGVTTGDLHHGNSWDTSMKFPRLENERTPVRGARGFSRPWAMFKGMAL